ncbi:hypothetical protein JHW43_000813 [Diplocarpon mali]|nr:hypothetical protein JHW43_000813 [Diplocarpon mali]
MTTFWNPRSVLDINPSEKDFCCTAKVSSKNQRGMPQDGPRRCQQSRLKSESKEEAGSMLDALGRIDVVAGGVDEDMAEILGRIAELTMCPATHKKPARSQAEQLGKEWLGMIVDYVAAEGLARQREPRMQRVDAPPVSAPEDASGAGQTTSRSTPGARATPRSSQKLHTKEVRPHRFAPRATIKPPSESTFVPAPRYKSASFPTQPDPNLILSGPSSQLKHEFHSTPSHLEWRPSSQRGTQLESQQQLLRRNREVQPYAHPMSPNANPLWMTASSAVSLSKPSRK